MRPCGRREGFTGLATTSRGSTVSERCSRICERWGASDCSAADAPTRSGLHSVWSGGHRALETDQPVTSRCAFTGVGTGSMAVGARRVPAGLPPTLALMLVTGTDGEVVLVPVGADGLDVVGVVVGV